MAFATTAETEPTGMQRDTELDLIAQCRKGQRNAQYALYHRYKDWAFNLAYRMTNNRQDAEDITQKIFVKMFNRIKTFRGEAAFSSWFYRLGVNVCLSHLRSGKKRREYSANAFSHQIASKVATSSSHINLRPFLEDAIQQLPEGYRMVYVLYEIHGYSHREIGAILDVTEGTSKSQLHKARKELKRLLEPLLLLNQSLQ